MKNIKLRIVYLILGSALLLFALFVLAVNVIIPSHDYPYSFISERGSVPAWYSAYC